MTSDLTTPAEPTPEPTAEELAERLLASAVTTMETLSTFLGMRLGLYRALADGSADPRQLAATAGIHPRYAREWLEQQAVAGILRAEGGDADADPYARSFTLPAGHREALLDTDSPYFAGPLPGIGVSFAAVLPELTEAFRTGDGVAYAAYGKDTRHGIAGLNRPMFLAQLVGWVAALPDIEQRLTTGPARVLDLGCGAGASTAAIATAFPRAQVRGVDLDAASISEAAGSAAAQGLADRVTFEQADAATLDAEERYDLVCVFEALHDMADPVATLRAARRLLAPGGAVLIGDERVAEHFSAPGDLLERLNYGFSVLHCLPATRAEGSAVEAGTVLRAGTVREYASQAGYPRFVELPVEHDLWRFYRLDPA